MKHIKSIKNSKINDKRSFSYALNGQYWMAEKPVLNHKQLFFQFNHILKRVKQTMFSLKFYFKFITFSGMLRFDHCWTMVRRVIRRKNVGETPDMAGQPDSQVFRDMLLTSLILTHIFKCWRNFFNLKSSANLTKACLH